MLFILNRIRSLTIYLSVGLIIVVFFALYYIYYGWTLYGYELVNYREDDVHFLKDDERVVGSTVVDFDGYLSILAGYQFPVDYLECSGGSRYAMRVNNSRQYFILESNKDRLYEFSRVDDFNNKLLEIGVKKSINLDSSKFDRFWSGYSQFYKDVEYENCVVMDGP